MTEDSDFLQRRALVAAATLGVGLAASLPASAQVKHEPAAWTPAKEKLDDWMDAPAAHRFAFDCTSPNGAGAALSFIRTYYIHSKEGYDLEPTSLATIMILRAGATPVAFNDTIWAKYGTLLAGNAGLIDPVTRAAPVRNIYNTRGVSAPGANGVTLADLILRGVRIAVCGSATSGVADFLAKATQGQSPAIRAELVANLVPNARMVPAGIIALNRVQERGYAVAYNS